MYRTNGTVVVGDAIGGSGSIWMTVVYGMRIGHRVDENQNIHIII